MTTENDGQDEGTEQAFVGREEEDRGDLEEGLSWRLGGSVGRTLDS